jgi:integrase
MIAAGCNAKQLATWMGHSTIVITLDRYGHLFPGAERDGADMLDRFLSSALAT